MGRGEARRGETTLDDHVPTSDSRPARLRDGLQAMLRAQLPGATVHARALPEGYRRPDPPAGTSLADASVLIALTEDERGVRFPLIQRPASMILHPGQVGLPGGAREPGESSLACALREAREEIGFDERGARLLGFLTPVVIPVSLFRVETAVVWSDLPASYLPHEAEVARILFADPDDLLRRGLSAAVERETPHGVLGFPAFEVDGAIVWGATALILCEFLALWSDLRAGSGRGRGTSL